MSVFLFTLLAVATAEKYNCGQSTSWHGAGSSGSHVIGGSDAPRNAYPWQVSMEKCLSFGCFHSCGGVLISSTFIVTAAHCVSSNVLSDYNLILGQHVRGEIGANDPRRLVPSKIIIHRNFRRDGAAGFPYDIALIELSKPAPVDGRTIVPARLPPRHPTDYTSSECWISGWGRTSSDSNALPSTLQHARVNVMSQKACREIWKNRISFTHVCVFDEESAARGACNGDSGGPLNCRAGGRWEVAGVTSWGVRDCLTRYPSVYTRLSFFRPWIRMRAGVYQEEICQ